MIRWTVTAALLVALLSGGCADRTGNPVTLKSDSGPFFMPVEKIPQTNLWGFYDCYLDAESMTVEVIANRTVMGIEPAPFNIVPFLNNDPLDLGFYVNGANFEGDRVDIDINVSISHPFPDMNEFDGYDVRGVFIGNGSKCLQYDTDLRHSIEGTDQFMGEPAEILDPTDPVGSQHDPVNPIGYTRWYNPDEFSKPGICGYTPGIMAPSAYTGSATLNPYEYFADGLNVNDNAWEYFDSSIDPMKGSFTAGHKNTRRYRLRFPKTVGVKFNYAVIATWGGAAGGYHPSHCGEAIVVSDMQTEGIHYVNDDDWGGNIGLDIRIYNWESVLDENPPDEYRLIIESDLLSEPYFLTDQEMVPLNPGESIPLYHVSIPTDLPGIPGWENDLWIIVESTKYNYSNPFGISNDAWYDPLTSFFRSRLFVMDEPYNQPPVCEVECKTAMPAEGWAPVMVEFDASDSFDPEGEEFFYEWDFNGDGIFGDHFDSGHAHNPTVGYDEDYTGQVCVRLTDNPGGHSECCTWVDITTHPLKNLEVTNPNGDAIDMAVDHQSGDILVLYGNNQVRRYDCDNYLESFTTVNTNQQAGNPWYIDAAENGYWLVVKMYEPAGTTDYIRSLHFSSSDMYLTCNQNSVLTSNLSNWGPVDAVCMSSEGSWPNDHVQVYGYRITTGVQYTYCTGYADTSFPYTWNQYRYWGTSYPVYGPEYLRYTDVVAAEPSATGYGGYVWFVEDNDYIVTRWEVTGGSTMDYAGPCFGTSNTQVDGDDGLNGPLDLTTDLTGNMYILDELSTGDIVIKHFEWDAGSTTPLTSFGTSDDYDYPPFRIDGCYAAGGMVCVLCDAGNGDFYVSLFTQDDIPDS